MHINRQHHQQEVQAFLQKHFSAKRWTFSLPSGHGNETYFAHGSERTYFVKLNVHLARYQMMAAIGLTPPVLAVGQLEDGASIIVQSYIDAAKPSRKDYRDHLEHIAAATKIFRQGRL